MYSSYLTLPCGILSSKPVMFNIVEEVPSLCLVICIVSNFHQELQLIKEQWYLFVLNSVNVLFCVAYEANTISSQ